MPMSLAECRYAARSLVKNPSFSLAAVLILGITIGACTAIAGVVYAILVKPLPYAESRQLVRLAQVNRDGGRSGFSDPNFEDLRAQARVFDGVAEYNRGVSSVIVGAEPMRAVTAAVSRDFFRVFRTAPFVGRLFANDDLHEGAPAVAVLSRVFWQRHFGDVTTLSGLTIRIEGKPYAVVGVLPTAFAFPPGAEIWTPREQRPRNPYRTGHNWQVVARVKDGMTVDAARADATGVARQLRAQYGESTWMTDVSIVPLQEDLVGRVRPVLLLLQAAVGLLLVLACANLTNLFLVRASGQRRELAVRASLGATRASLAWRSLAEGLLIATAGGTLGILVAYPALQMLAAFQPAGLPRVSEIAVSWPVGGVAVGATFLSAFILSMASAWQAARPDLVRWLRQGERGGAAIAGGGALRNALVVAQLAVSLMLLVGAGLLGRSLSVLLSQDLGFRTDGLLTIELASPSIDVRPTATGIEVDSVALRRLAQRHERALDRLAALPGVVQAGGIDVLPLTNRSGSDGTFVIVRGDEEQTLTSLLSLVNDPNRTGEAQCGSRCSILREPAV